MRSDFWIVEAAVKIIFVILFDREPAIISVSTSIEIV